MFIAAGLTKGTLHPQGELEAKGEEWLKIKSDEQQT